MRGIRKTYLQDILSTAHAWFDLVKLHEETFHKRCYNGPLSLGQVESGVQINTILSNIEIDEFRTETSREAPNKFVVIYVHSP